MDGAATSTCNSPISSTQRYAENVFAWLAISSYPDPIITTAVLGLASAAKTITSWVGGVALLSCLGIRGFRRVRELNTRRNS